MKHASDSTLESLEDLLLKLREQPGLTEKKRGVFYRKAVAILHFHEDDVSLFADLKVAGEWQRFSVTTQAERAAFVIAFKSSLI